MKTDEGLSSTSALSSSYHTPLLSIHCKVQSLLLRITPFTRIYRGTLAFIHGSVQHQALAAHACIDGQLRPSKRNDRRSMLSNRLNHGSLEDYCNWSADHLDHYLCCPLRSASSAPVSSPTLFLQDLTDHRTERGPLGFFIA